MIHQNVAHDTRSYREEVGTGLKAEVLLAYQPEIGLVDQGGGLESMVLALAAHVGVREPMKLAVDTGKKLLESRFIPLAPFRKKLRNFTLG